MHGGRASPAEARPVPLRDAQLRRRAARAWDRGALRTPRRRRPNLRGTPRVVLRSRGHHCTRNLGDRGPLLRRAHRSLLRGTWPRAHRAAEPDVRDAERSARRVVFRSPRAHGQLLQVAATADGGPRRCAGRALRWPVVVRRGQPRVAPRRRCLARRAPGRGDRARARGDRARRAPVRPIIPARCRSRTGGFPRREARRSSGSGASCSSDSARSAPTRTR